jgi:hypothetical protein
MSLKALADASPGPTDIDALASYLTAAHEPVAPRIDGRIARADTADAALCLSAASD